jgi:hypothetical protein
MGRPKHKGPGDHHYQFNADYWDITSEIVYASDLKHKLKVGSISLPKRPVPYSTRKSN